MAVPVQRSNGAKLKSHKRAQYSPWGESCTCRALILMDLVEPLLSQILSERMRLLTCCSVHLGPVHPKVSIQQLLDMSILELSRASSRVVGAKR